MRFAPPLLLTIATIACFAGPDARSTEGRIPEATPMTPSGPNAMTTPRERSLPTGSLEVNMGCFGSPDFDRRLTPTPSPTAMPKGGAMRSTGASAPVAAAPPASMSQGGLDDMSSGSMRGGAEQEEAKAEAPATAAAKPMKPAEGQSASPSMPKDKAPQGEWAPPPPPTRGPIVDWGGVVYLSNDDSSSLASPQRLLYALDRGASFTTGQIRPHELLNYFNFDTVEPAQGDVFGVAVSSERLDDSTLSLALAVKGASPPRDDLDLTVVVDRSGSMSAEGRMAYTQRALHKMSDQLHRGDRVNLVVFDHEVCTPLKNYVVGRDDPATLARVIDAMTPRGSTDLNLGLKTGYALAKSVADRSRAGRVMVFTDAILNTGDVNPETVSEIGHALDDQGIRLTGVGVGSEFRDDVLDKLTEKGKGAYVFLGSERVVDRLFGAGFNGLVQTIAYDVHFALDLPPSLGMKKFYGEESSTHIEDVQPTNFQAGNAQLFLEDLAIQPGRLNQADPISLTATWVDPQTGAKREQSWTTTVGDALSADPHNSRKGHALMDWSDVLLAKAMGGDACGQPFQDYRRSIYGLEGDAEIAYVSELLGKWCGRPEPISTWTAAAYTKIRFDSDTPVTEVALDCGGAHKSVTVTGSDTVATFQAPTGACQVTLYGAVPMTQRVDVPATGGDVRCVVRGGRMSCG